jgi:class 3 adenylate cyclase
MSNRYFKKHISQSQHQLFQEYIQQIDLIYEIKLGDKISHDCAVVFFALSNFMEISNSLSSEKVFDIIQELYSTISESVIRFNGLINKYPRNGILAFFPRNYSDERKIVVETALDCITAVMDWFYNNLQKQWNSLIKSDYTLELSAGIDAGNIYIGHAGSIYHGELVLLGDQVNCAQKCKDAACKKEVIIGQDAADMAGFLYSKYFSQGPGIWVKYTANNVNYKSQIFNWEEFAQAATWIKKK